jgi:hypothetical protein
VEERRLGFQTWFNQMLQLPEIQRSRDMRALLEIPPVQLRLNIRKRTNTSSQQQQQPTAAAAATTTTTTPAGATVNNTTSVVDE